MRMILLGAASMMALATPALAQDAEFNGAYVGGSIGYSFQSKDDNETIMFDRDLNGSFGDTVVTSAAGAPNAFSPGFCGGSATGTANSACNDDDDGISYAARVGFDYQMNSNFVVGVVLEAGKTDINDSVSAFSTTPASYTMTREIDWNAGLRARLGYAAGKTLFYATGGGAYARVDHSFTTSNTANSFTGRGKNDAWGYAAGGGVEHKFGESFSVGVEYLYTNLKDDNYRVRAGTGTAPATNPFLLAGAGGTDFRRSGDRFDFHGVRATAAFRF